MSGLVKKTLIRSNAMSDDDDTNSRLADLSVRLVTSQTKPVLSSSVSKDSTCFTDATDTNLHDFIVKTLHKNEKDRKLILRTEELLIKLMSDESRQSVTFEEMTSYERMIVHRVAAWFGLDHNVTQSGKNVVVSKTDKAKMHVNNKGIRSFASFSPERDFKSLVTAKPYTDPETKRSNSKSRTFGAPSSSPMVPNQQLRHADQSMYYAWQPTPLFFNPLHQPVCSLMQIPTSQFPKGGKFEAYQPMPQPAWFPFNVYPSNMKCPPQCATSMNFVSTPYSHEIQQFNNVSPSIHTTRSSATHPSTR